ncbi:MAG: hypothetical protein IPG34_19675 [Rhodocyclaceae bacterium]|nr:hypothetical protein [Rhodocyclaceae bacterium]
MLSLDEFRKRAGHICPHCLVETPAMITDDEWRDDGNYTAEVLCPRCRGTWTVIWALATQDP